MRDRKCRMARKVANNLKHYLVSRPEPTFVSYETLNVWVTFAFKLPPPPPNLHCFVK